MNRYITRKSIAEIIVFITTAFVSLWLFGPVQQLLVKAAQKRTGVE